ncbi:MAG TPA: tetratricopeptide repeat protein [Candidatus Dormibacteraeota bacterium]|nr:tetratricopeptide repeat protein [Candidatus Dormibacteraeota bacterium]
MRNITLKITLLAMLMTLCRYSAATPSAEQSNVKSDVKMDTMSVTELEKAGDAARSQKDYDLAIDYFQAALRKDRKNAVLYNKLGLAELRKDDLVRARLHFERATKLNSKYTEAVNNIGAVEYMRKNYGAAAKYFKKAVALDENHATYHVNLGAAWFSQKKMDRAIAEYTRAMELDPDALRQESRTGIAAQIASPEERAQYSYLLAKVYAKRGDVEGCLQCLKRAKEDGYRNLANVYKDEEFSRLRENPKLQEVVPPPVAK